ncbi:hypothetical protein [Stenotrophomonas geniculata]|uniref:hypothetical protein n=1 Tax=Stenotrophomonas geniculata TaxID=86188 RepID=UPI003D965686
MANPYQAGQALGTALFGNTRDTYTDQLGRNYQVERALQEARQARSKAVLANQINEQRALVNPELVSGVLGGDDTARATLGSIALLANDRFDAGQLNDVLGAAARSSARDAALGGNWEGANANLMAVANGPQELGAVQGQNLLQNRFKEGGGGISTTEQGRAGIAADAARAAASYASANSSNASAARTRQGMGIDAAEFGLKRSGQWNPGGRSAGGGVLGDAGSPKLTEGQSKDLVYLKRGDEANKLLETMAGNLTASGGQQGSRGAADVFLRGLPGIGDSSAVNALVSAPRQQAEQAAREFLAAVLRKDTGAAITAQEFDIYGQTYLPQPGDSPATLRQKAKSRQVALDAIATGLGPERAAIARPGPAGVGMAGGAVRTLGDPPAASGGPTPGAIRNGYRFRGGNPADRNAWEKI